MSNKMDPFIKFQIWFDRECEVTEALIPSACCLSTIGTDGYPNARFVALKEVKNDQFIITGPLNSRKGQELKYKPRAALTFWWPSTEKQVRVQGDAHIIAPSEADRYFSERSRESRIISTISDQGTPVVNTGILEAQFKNFSNKYENREIPRPDSWGGIAIMPVRIEFLDFKTSRFHERILYIRDGKNWHEQYLQP